MRQRIVTVFIILILGGLAFQSYLTGSEKIIALKEKTQSNNDLAEYASGAIIVKFKSDAPGVQILERTIFSGMLSIDSKIQRFGINHIEKVFKLIPQSQQSYLPDLSRIFKFSYTSPYDAKMVAETFAKDPAIEYAEPVFIQQMDTDPNDPLFNQQWYLRNVKAPQGWDIEQGDSTVILAIIDSGVDSDHPDLVDRIWINRGEIPGNNIDDDGNGFVDDINGWDFEKENSDPNPDPDGLDNDSDGQIDEGVEHGTKMAGLAAATTNNSEGMAGVGWHCSIMPLKSLSDEGSGFSDVTARGILYAANNGAHVINLSLSGSSPSQVQNDAIKYAYQKGVIILASAGNNNNSAFRYPAAFEKVVAVGANGSDADLKSSISNFGIYVDVLAPGADFYLSPPTEIISTVYYNPGYGFNELYRARTREGYLTAGTSQATAIVSGLMGLVISQHKDWTNEQVIRQVVLTADNVDHLNPGYEEQLGSGRINAYRALTEINPAEVAPRIQLIGEVVISDSIGGDNDNIFERGETIEVTAPTFRNFSISPGMNVVFTISSDDTDLTIVNGIYNYGYLPPDTTVAIPFSFSFTVNNNARGKTAKLFVGWQSDGGYSDADTFRIIIGKIPILIVDDDSDADDDDFPDAEQFYTNILDNFKLNYAVWDRYKLGALGPDQMNNFPIVIWLCAWCFPSLDPDDQLAISNFLDNGGSLFISGQDLGWDFNDPTGGGYQQRDFYTQYLHAIYHADTSPVNDVVGISGDPIGDKMQFAVWQPGLPAANQYPDEIEPGPGASAVFEYAGGLNHKFGIKYEGSHKVVYFAMGVEAIDSEQNTSPDDLSPIKTEILGRVINWLNFIDHQPLSDTENLTAPAAVVVKVTNSLAASDLLSMELNWKKENETSFKVIPMTAIGTDQYSATIPGPGEITAISYYLKMVNSYYDWNSPQGAPQQVYSYYVGPDNIKPTFSHQALQSSINGESPRTVFVGIKDNIGIDNNTVYLHFRSRSVTDSLKLTVGANPEQFYGSLLPLFAYGDTVSYYFTAYDKAASPNRGISELFSFIVGYEDFESGLIHWSTPPDGWGLEQLYAHSGINSINDSPNTSPYPNNRNVSIATNFGIDLSTTEHATLRFYTKLFLEINHDFGYIEVSNNGGTTWNQLGSAFNGFVGQWKLETVSLDSYCGAGNNDVRIRFRMVSDANQGPPVPGWFIDDVQIIEGVDFSQVTEANKATIPDQFYLYQNYPNPFNPKTTIRFDLPISGMVLVKIFNIRGELVCTLIQGQMSAGSHAIQWNGKDENGQNLTSGVYFYKLSAGKFYATRKLLMIK